MTDFATVKAAARGRWPEILTALGVPSESLTGNHGPCPGCGGQDRFRYLKNEEGGWICGQGGTPTGGDGFDLLVHVHGWKAGESMKAVANHLGIQPDNSPKARQQARERKLQAMRADYEEALLHELTVLRIAIGRRVVDRTLARDRRYQNVAPWFRPMPDEHWEREVLAARRIHNALGALYGVK